METVFGETVNGAQEIALMVVLAQRYTSFLRLNMVG